MNIADIVILMVLSVLVGAAIYRIYKAKKSGAACMGCSSKGSCTKNCGCEGSSDKK